MASKTYKNLFIITALLAMLSPVFAARAEPDEPPILLEKVEFLESHDPGWLLLKGKDSGITYTAHFYYETISGDEIDKWEKAELFNIEINPNEGVGIRDVHTKKFYKIFFEEENHPITNNMEKCKETAEGRLGFTGCFQDAYRQWILEQTLFVSELGMTKQLTQSRKAWENYTETVIHEFSESRRENGGTQDATDAAILAERMQKNHYLELMDFY